MRPSIFVAEAPSDFAITLTLMERLRHLGHDPNWRRRPSVLDRIQGLTASPGRGRKAKAQ